jgi:hypothetical protein
MAENDGVTMGELDRRLGKLEARHEGLPEKYVLRREYDSDQRNTNTRLEDNKAAIQKTDGKVETVEAEMAAAEKERQSVGSKRRWELFLMFAGPIAAALVAIYFSQGGQTP